MGVIEGGASQTTGTILDYLGNKEEERSASDPNAKPYKEGHPAEHESGVQWIGPWEEPADGFSEHTRRSARSLSEAGVPVQLRGIRPRADVDEDLADSMRDLLDTSIANYEVRVAQFVPSIEAAAKWLVHPRLSAADSAARNSATVAYAVFEREGIGPEMARLLSNAGRVWVACRRSANALIEAGVNASKIDVVPVPFFPNDPHLPLASKPRRPGVHRFLHIGKWEARKAQDKLILGFMLAFKPGEAELIIKTSKSAPEMAGYPKGPSRAAELALGNLSVRDNGWNERNVSPSIRIIRERLEDQQMIALHAWADTYVTVSHGEGFDMPAFDAALSGRRLIYTMSGGPEDFATIGEDVLVDDTPAFEPCHPWYEWEEKSYWTAVDENRVADAFRVAAARGTARIKRDLSKFSAKSVGAFMRENLQGVASAFGAKIC